VAAEPAQATAQRALELTTIDYNISFSYDSGLREQTKTSHQLVKDEGGVPTVTSGCACQHYPTRGGVALARTGAPQRIVWRRAQ
jgi:hypothetical protein